MDKPIKRKINNKKTPGRKFVTKFHLGNISFIPGLFQDLKVKEFARVEGLSPFPSPLTREDQLSLQVQARRYH